MRAPLEQLLPDTQELPTKDGAWRWVFEVRRCGNEVHYRVRRSIDAHSRFALPWRSVADGPVWPLMCPDAWAGKCFAAAKQAQLRIDRETSGESVEGEREGET